ncbi:hypothetical protein BCR44DRAFT_1514376 [Catenaria anguillulae PL171]|uniref:DUF221-domain-containing protein n=1 Tax=Catenaria anguillulae PL171 TaxID=765915 RepID=A0A1Y2HH54_9FUNG|nr:hypothetical protein BCR44DRAFT_1514376 [Catenaria anguillulae PL171]
MADSGVAPKEAFQDLDGLAFQLLTTMTIGAAAVAFFCFMRPLNPTVYEPNKVLQRSFARRGLHQFFHDSKVPEKLPEVSKSLFGWFMVVYRTTEKELLESLGIDATIFIKVCYSFVKIACVMVVTGIVTMLLNSLSLTMGFRKLPQTQGRGSKISDWDVNQAIMFDPSFLWGHVVMGFILTGSVFYVFNSLWDDFVDIRQAYFRSSSYYNAIHARTILVTNLKTSMLDNQALAEAMYEVNVKHFTSATVGLKVSTLQDAVEKREKYIIQLEDVVSDTFSEALKNHHPDSASNLALPNVQLPPEAIKLCEKIKALDAQIYDMRRNGCEAKAIHAGFVEFEFPEECHEVVEQLKGKASGSLRIQPAPRPSDLIWRNLGSEPSSQQRMRRFGNLFVLGVCFGWLFLLNAILPLTDPITLFKVWPDLGLFLFKRPKLVTFMKSFIPPMLYNGFLFFAPILFRKVSDYQGAYTLALRTKDTIRKVFLFYVIGFFLLLTISSYIQQLLSDVTNITESVKGPNAGAVTLSVLQVLYGIAKGAIDAFIRKSSFWLGWVLNGTGFIHIELVRAAVLLLTWFKKSFYKLTPREAMMINAPPAFEYDALGGVLLFWFFISMVYALIQPLILLISPFFFVFATIIYKWELMYIFGKGSDSAGDFYPTMYKRVAASVLSAQGLFIAVLLINQIYPQAVAMGVLFISSIFISRHIYNSHLHAAMYFDPAHGPYDPEALRRDAEARASGRRDKYLHPALIEHLILPLVDPRVEHLLEPYFPELSITYKAPSNRQSAESLSSAFGGHAHQRHLPPAAEPGPSSPLMSPMANRPASPMLNKQTLENHQYYKPSPLANPNMQRPPSPLNMGPPQHAYGNVPPAQHQHQQQQYRTQQQQYAVQQHSTGVSHHSTGSYQQYSTQSTTVTTNAAYYQQQQHQQFHQSTSSPQGSGPRHIDQVEMQPTGASAGSRRHSPPGYASPAAPQPTYHQQHGGHGQQHPSPQATPTQPMLRSPSPMQNWSAGRNGAPVGPQSPGYPQQQRRHTPPQQQPQYGGYPQQQQQQQGALTTHVLPPSRGERQQHQQQYQGYGSR